MTRIHAAIAAGLVAAFLVAGWVGGGLVLRQIRLRQAARFAPSLEPDFRRHLVSDPDREWLTYCRRIGTGPLGDALQTLGQELRTLSFEEFRRRRAVLETLELRVAEGFNRAFDFPAAEMRMRRDRTLTDSASFEVRRLERLYIGTSTDTTRSPAERIAIVDQVAARFAAAGDSDRALYASILTTRFEFERGRPDLGRARLEGAIARARRLREHYVLCQLLGEKGDMYLSAGRQDSMALCYDEGIALALSHGLIDQAARLFRFYAGYYLERGRLALALERLAEAERLCAMPGGEVARLRMQIDYTRFLADLGCWDLASRSLRRIPPLLRTMPQFGRRSEVLRYSFDLDLLRARLAFAEGHVSDGSRLMNGISSAVPAESRVAGYARLFQDWAAGLETNRRFEEAIGICDRGIIHCDSVRLADSSLELRVQKARLFDRLGQEDSAQRVLDEARLYLRRPAESGTRVARDADVLGARLMLHQGQVTEARREIERIFREYRQRLGRDAGSSLSYLELDEAASLRAAIHEIEGFSPAEGYAFELEWRSLSRRLGGARRAGSPAGRETGWPDTRRVPLLRDAIHLVYWFDGARLLRWTARPAGVRVDTLPMSASRCLANVQEALEQLQSESPSAGEVLGPRALAALRSLSSQLLPPGLAGSEESPLRLEVSPDGPLMALPFEALPAPGPHGTAPLAEWADVAYVRGKNDGPLAAAGPAVIVTNPRLSVDVENRYSGAGMLAGSQVEVQSALARWPQAVILDGDRATKDSIRRWWPGASIIYLATHHVRDPDAPFLGFVPLSAPPGAAPDASLLEIADVHELDLSSCRLAVLASCSSGVPYRSAIRPGPSLADAFLDSGTRAVVGSFWDVGDAEAREFMTAFLSAWREGGDVAAALGRARRQVMATPVGAAPRVWAAWSVATSSR